ncbi:MAG: hypothetical protein KA138_10310 [Saprospiraceae bacterium]|nr:hypothetical protein [Saprospiraceae bacterium]
MDASNPMKILVWYADFQTAVFLDRNMTELGRLNVAEAGWPSVSSIAMASDANLWIYDMASFKLLKITTSGVKFIESEPLSFGFHDLDDVYQRPVIIKENGERLFLCFERFGIYAFDIFGQNPDIIFGSSLFEKFEIIGNTITWFHSLRSRIEISDLSNSLNKGSSIRAQFLLNKVFWFSQKRVFVRSESGVEVYGF